MASNSQPPPVAVPQKLLRDPELANYYGKQKDALYQLWANYGNFVSSPPASASASGKTGDYTWDSSYFYVCVATDTWKRAALSAW